MTNEIEKSQPLYLYVVVIWLVAVIVSAVMIVETSINSARQTFQVKAENLFRFVSHRVSINETILDGFAATVDAVGRLDSTKIRDYARRIRQRYPDIYMFEIAEKIQRRNKTAFEQDMRRRVYAGFSIRRFTNVADRKWYPTKSSSFYLPIIFMEPFPPGSRKVLGLDLGSNAFFVESLQQSARLHTPVATRPFRLDEGQLAYVIHRPINTGHDVTGKYGVAERYVMLVLLTKSLFDDSLQSLRNYGVTLYHSGYVKAHADGILYKQELPGYSALQCALFPRFSASLPLQSKTQPFILQVEKQLGWSVVKWSQLKILLVLALITYYIVIRYARSCHLSQLQRVRETNRLFYLANHDALTGLANRNLMMDRLEHALKQALRLNSRLAVLFLDLDDFKQINDRHGHDFGDRVLKYVAERLRACIRSGDTLARRSGDEFVVILENIMSRETVEQVVRKIYDDFEQCVDIDGIHYHVRISIGIAMYPEDGRDAKKLLNLADKRMYERK